MASYLKLAWLRARMSPPSGERLNLKRSHRIIFWLIALLAMGTFVFGLWQFMGALTGANGAGTASPVHDGTNAPADPGDKSDSQAGGEPPLRSEDSRIENQ